MQLNVKYNPNEPSEVMGQLTNDEIEFLVQFALATLMKQGVMYNMEQQSNEVAH